MIDWPPLAALPQGILNASWSNDNSLQAPSQAILKRTQQAADKAKSWLFWEHRQTNTRHTAAQPAPPSYLSATQSVSRGRQRALSGSPVQGNHNSVYHLLPVLACHLKHLLLDLFKVDPQLERFSSLCMHNKSISDQTQPGNSAAESPPDKALSHCDSFTIPSLSD